ncbi:hypothetical protein LFL96_06220 [Paraburkholderia sp. D15]|uniref:helix-turn-helix domain-containing protein n=1 Tax=Paraburkholderia sp. D15 TaxID=2880218 RepID=UPI0024784DEE|nr:DUF6543 domain-containing protein [Paraburkholderia sp. D15]WGS51096.1 hypothetical protein LFL96_06220 [Paraburkholderia sp. D15]
MKISSGSHLPHERSPIEGGRRDAGEGVDASSRPATLDAPGEIGARLPLRGTDRSPEQGADVASQTYAVLQKYASAPAADLRADSRTAGLYRDGKGNAYINANDRAYAVRYDRDNGTWRLHHSAEPAKAQYPVRSDGRGNWEIHHEVGLLGGGPRISHEIKDQIAALLRDGWSNAAVMKMFSISQSVVYAVRDRIAMPPAVPLASFEFRENVATRLAAGTPAAQIARELGVHPRTVLLIEEARRATTPRLRDIRLPGPSTGGEASVRGEGDGTVSPTQATRRLQMHEILDRNITRPPPRVATISDVCAMRNGGWSDTAIRNVLKLSDERWEALGLRRPSGSSTPSAPQQLRPDLVAGTSGRMSDAQVARELGVQQQMVRLPGDAQPERTPALASRMPLAPVGALPARAVPSSTVSRRPPSPQPGTSTGGETYPRLGSGGSGQSDSAPPPKRLRTESVPPDGAQALNFAVIKRLGQGVESGQVARELRIPERDVVRMGIAHLERLIGMHEGPGHDARPGDAARSHTVSRASTEPEPQRMRVPPEAVARSDRAMLDRLLDEEFSDLDMTAFKALIGESPEHSPEQG